MNETPRSPLPNPPAPAAAREAIDALESLVARRITSRLDDAALALPAGVDERLRFARRQAVARARARQVEAATADVVVAAGAAARRGGRWPWLRPAAWVPVLLVVAGLWAIGEWRDQRRARTAAELDARLLTDVLPPAAYADPGFEAFLRQGGPR